MSIPDFIARCDRYCEAAGVSRTWLSKLLFKDTYKLGLLAEGKVDIGVKRLARARADLDDAFVGRTAAGEGGRSTDRAAA